MEASERSCCDNEWSPEGHSWILVPETASETGASVICDGASTEVGISPATWAPTAASTDDGLFGGSLALEEYSYDHTSSEPAAAAPLPACALPSPDTPAASPKALSHSFLQEGENVAALAVSEILSPECPLPQCLSDASYAGPSITTARKIGALPFPPIECALCGHVLSRPVATAKSEAGDSEPAMESFPLAEYFWSMDTPICWSRPLAVVAVLLASHAAAMFFGVYIGGKLQAATAANDSLMLMRRFSSGPCGTHARLSWS